MAKKIRKENFAGYGFKFVEPEHMTTFNAHEKVLREKGKVLWGLWKSNPDSSMTVSKGLREDVNSNINGADFFAISLDDVIKMHTSEVLLTEEVKNEGLEKFIPDYYDVDTPVYGWLVVDNISVHDLSLLEELASDRCGDSLATMKAEKRLNQMSSGRPWTLNKVS